MQQPPNCNSSNFGSFDSMMFVVLVLLFWGVVRFRRLLNTTQSIKSQCRSAIAFTQRVGVNPDMGMTGQSPQTTGQYRTVVLYIICVQGAVFCPGKIHQLDKYATYRYRAASFLAASFLSMSRSSLGSEDMSVWKELHEPCDTKPHPSIPRIQ